MIFYQKYYQKIYFQLSIRLTIIYIYSMQKAIEIASSFSSKFHEIIKFQLRRYTERGYWIFISSVIFISYFTIYPDIISYVWPSLLSTFNQTWLFILVIGALNVTITSLYSAVMYVIYTRKFAFLEQYRCSQEQWPWEKNYEQWISLLTRSIQSNIINAVLLGPFFLYIDCQLSFDIKMQMQDLPQSKFTYFWQFFFFLVVEEIWNYIIHYILHRPSFYWIHKRHHEYRNVVSVAGQNIHPIEYFLSSSLSTALGYKILVNFYPVHMFSLIIWMTFRIIETGDSHAGYNWPWVQSALIPGNSGDNYHYYHHKVNVENYCAVLYFMDSLFGSNKGFWQHENKQKNVKSIEKEPKQTKTS